MLSIRTARLVLRPYNWGDLADLAALKGNPLVWAMMLGGVRTPMQTIDDLAAELAYWGSHGFGMWTFRDGGGRLVGVTGLHERPDARGVALRFAADPAFRGQGLVREAAGAVLNDAHDRARLTRVVAVARDTNIGSRTVLGAIGMRPAAQFLQGGYEMTLYQSVRLPR